MVKGISSNEVQDGGLRIKFIVPAVELHRVIGRWKPAGTQIA